MTKLEPSDESSSAIISATIDWIDTANKLVKISDDKLLINEELYVIHAMVGRLYDDPAEGIIHLKRAIEIQESIIVDVPDYLSALEHKEFREDLNDTTRNSVIGTLHRNGLTGRD